jgi:glutamate-1-semialdehyde 2,1-aminomutase
VASAADRSWAVFPAGSQGEYDLPRELTLVLARGEGATVWDTDGRAFIDFTMGWGSVLLGHAHPAIVEAVRRRAALGSNFAYVTDASLELAEELARAVPCAERLRFCASGTEATAYAARLARAYTRRSRVLKFEGAYHGANEVGTVSLFPRRLLAFPQGEPTSAGVPAGAVADVLVAPYNDLGKTTAILAAHRDDVAAIIVEPLHRCTPPQPGFLAGLRELTAELGVLLIFDETVTGFRLAYGGAQEYYGVVPDLAALGKIVGGGFALAAVVGRAEIMRHLAPELEGTPEFVAQAGTLNGNPIAASAGLATLAELRRPGAYARLFQTGARIKSALKQAADAAGVPAQVAGEAPVFEIYFTDRPITDYRATLTADRSRHRVFTDELIRRGVLKAAGKFYVSLSHGEDEIRHTTDAFTAALRKVADDRRP